MLRLIGNTLASASPASHFPIQTKLVKMNSAIVTTPMLLLCSVLNNDLNDKKVINEYYLKLWAIFSDYIDDQLRAFNHDGMLTNADLHAVFSDFAKRHINIVGDREKKLLRLNGLLGNLCNTLEPVCMRPKFEGEWCIKLVQWVEKMDRFFTDFPTLQNMKIEEFARSLDEQLLGFLRDVWLWENNTKWLGQEWDFAGDTNDFVAARYRIRLFRERVKGLIGERGQLGAEQVIGTKGELDFFVDLIEVAELALALKVPSAFDLLGTADDAIAEFRRQNQGKFNKVGNGKSPFKQRNSLRHRFNSVHESLFKSVEAAWSVKSKANTPIMVAKADCYYQRVRQRYREGALIFTLVRGKKYKREGAIQTLAELLGIDVPQIEVSVNEVWDQVFLLFDSEVLK